jgi:Domain of unknown function (DUF4168)
MKNPRALLVFGFALAGTYFSYIPLNHGQSENRGSAVKAGPKAVNDNELHAFAKTYVRFQEIRTEYEPKWSVAKTTRDKGKVDQEVVAKFDVALEKEGLTAERYEALYQMVSADLGLREKALRLIEKERARS